MPVSFSPVALWYEGPLLVLGYVFFLAAQLLILRFFLQLLLQAFARVLARPLGRAVGRAMTQPPAA